MRSFRLNESAYGGIMRPMKTPTLPLILAISTLLAAPATALAATNHPAKKHPAQTKESERASVEATLASAGNADAQYQLGMALLKKAGAAPQGAKLRAEGLVWLDLAAVRGSLRAAQAASKEYETQGAPFKAYRMLYRAGQMGDKAAQNRFVDLVLGGKIDTLGGPDGAAWMTQRVESDGSRKGMVILGDAYRLSKGVAPDMTQAQKWYLAAALRLDMDAMVELGSIQLARPPEWRAPDKEIDRDGHHLPPSLWPVHWGARARNGSGSLDLGREEAAKAADTDPDHLTLVRSSMVEGQSWLERASRMGSAGARTVLAKAMSDGVTLPLDTQQASLLRQSAACAGDAAAMTALAEDAQMEIQGAPVHPIRAWVFWELAASHGDKDALTNRDRIAKALSPRQMARAKQIAQDWCVQPSQ